MTRLAHGVRPVHLHAFACGEHAAVQRAFGLFEIGDTRRRGRGRRAEQHFHDPLAAQHRRRAVGVGRECQDTAVAQQSPAGIVGIRDPAEVVPRNARDAVMPGQPLVDERVIGRE